MIINDNLEKLIKIVFQKKIIEKINECKLIPLSNFCNNITKGTTPTTIGKKFFQTGINFIKVESILENHNIDFNKLSYIDLKTHLKLKRSELSISDIIFTIAGTLGRFSLIDKSILPANTNQAVAIIKINQEKILPEYIYSLFISGWHKEYFIKNIQQAVQANLSLKTVGLLPIPILNKNDMKEYVEFILPIISEFKRLSFETRHLNNLKNYLLPKLMNGEINVENIEL